MDPNSTADPGLLPAGTMLGRYRLDALLGQGAFGAVYRAVSSDRGVRVALKVLGRRGADADSTVARFHREAELASRLRHPNSVRVLDRGEAQGWHFIVFELLEGESLEQLVERTGRVAPERAMEIAVQILDGLEEAHGIGLVHRDLKPANVFLVGGAGSTRVKIVDFGLAKSTNPGTLAGLTRAGTTVGTPLYMSPEQILGNEVGPPTDLFALGVVLAEMIHGGSIYEDAPVMSLLTDRIAGKPVPIPPELGASPLRAIVERATRPNPRERFPEAASMRAALVSLRGALTETSRIAAAATRAFQLPSAPSSAPLVPADRTIDVGRLVANRTIDVAEALGASHTAIAPVAAAPPGRGRSRALPLAIAAALLVVLTSGAIAFVVARDSGSTPTSSTSAKRATAPPSVTNVAPSRSTPQIPSTPPVKRADWLADPTPLIAILKPRFASDRVYFIQINEDQAYVTVEAQAPNTMLYVVTTEGAKPHREAPAPRQTRPIDLATLDRLPAMIADATKRAREAGKSTVLQFIAIDCPSCVNDGGGVEFSFNDLGSNRFGAHYDLAGRFVSAH